MHQSFSKVLESVHLYLRSELCEIPRFRLPSVIRAYYSIDELVTRLPGDMCDRSSLLFFLKADFEDIAKIFEINGMSEHQMNKLSKPQIMDFLASLVLSQLMIHPSFQVTFSKKGGVQFKHRIKQCRGCEAFSKGVGGENQQMHYGGCMKDPDDESFSDDSDFSSSEEEEEEEADDDDDGDDTQSVDLAPHKRARSVTNV
jgi:hypothetical protein